MKRIQTPDIARVLTRQLELTSPLELELEEVVQPVIIVGGESDEATTLDYGPTAVAAALSPLLYASWLTVVGTAGDTGYNAIVNPGPGILRITAVRAAAAAAQEFRLMRIPAPHGLAPDRGLTARDTRIVPQTTTLNHVLLSGLTPPGTWTILSRHRGTDVVWDREEMVLAVGSGAAVNVTALVQTYDVGWVVEKYL